MLTFCKCRALRGTLNQTFKAVSSLARRGTGIDVKLTLLAMRITAAILLISSLTVTAKSVSQTITLSGKNIPLTKVFTEIEKQSGYLVVFNEDVISSAKPITVEVKDYPLLDFMNETFSVHGLGYLIENRTIFVKKKSFAVRAPIVINPPIDVKGRVVDENGEPVEGATVAVKGTNRGVSTNVNGEFVLNEVDESASLIISGVNIEPRELKLAGQKNISITTLRKATSLNEVVVNKGYYTEKQRFSVGNVGHVSKEEIEKQPVQNPLLALQGRVPGLEITQTTGINGGGVKVRVQGINSISSIGNSQLSRSEPLIIVDGIPYPSSFSTNNIDYINLGGNPLNYLNPSDIESISVLKDADATAIYGSRAANGAILIITKKGKVGKPKLSFDLQQGWGKVTRHVDMMNTRQYLEMRNEALQNDGYSPDLNADYDLTLWDTTRYTDWQKEFIGGTARYTNINTGVSGGTALLQYLVNANFNRQTTVFPGNFANKAGGLHFSLNGSSPNRRLGIQLAGSYQYNQNDLPYLDLTKSAVLLEPNAPKLYNEDGSLNWALNASGSSTWNNPLANAIYTEYSNTTKNLVSNLNLSYLILPGLVLSSNFGYNSLQSDLFSGTKLEFYSPQYRPFFQRSARFGTRNISSWIVEPLLRLERDISKGKLDALIGSTIQKSFGKYQAVYSSGQPTDELLRALSAATSVKSDASGNENEYVTRFYGVFGRVGYNWDNKYLVNLTGRRDGSSKFGGENKFHNFWSVGAGWIFSEEKFLQSTRSWLSFGKLRASYGTTGNDQIANYGYLSLYNILNTDIRYQGTTSFDVGGLSNPYLQWEETRKFQGGIDVSFFNERFAIGVTYARNRSSNQLIGYSLPTITGFTSFTKNFPATIQNTSWELSLNTINVKSKNFNWSTNFNLTIPRNKVTSFPGIELTGYASGFNGVIIGEPIGIKKLYQYGGVDPTTGGYMLLDTLGGPLVPGFSSVKQGATVSLLPKLYGGISNSITYKGFQLDCFIHVVYQRGENSMFYTNAETPPGTFAGGYGNQPVTVLNRWQKPGNNSTIQRYNSDYSLDILPPLTDAGYTYHAGSYIRLKNVSLSWQLPAAWSKKAHLQTTRIYFNGQNLATITGYKGLDPETRSISSLPPLQMWTLGAKIEL